MNSETLDKGLQQRKLKIGIVVHGRFHAFDLALHLLKRGHDVTLFTNYPKWAVKRFGFPADRVRSFWLHGITTRITHKLDPSRKIIDRDDWWCPHFGRWVAHALSLEQWDVIHLWSGVAEEVLQSAHIDAKLKTLMRGSAHIHIQARLLFEEEQRSGIRQDRPGDWMIAREHREYHLADIIVILSTFARRSFIDQGIAAEKVMLLPLGANLDAFRPSTEIIDDRCRRILSRQPLRVLYVGAISFQKGFLDMVAIIESLTSLQAPKRRFQFRMVGPLVPEVKSLLPKLKGNVEIIPKQPQAELPFWYAWADVFIFPTIQDGYANVLAQATASGLPIITTTNCGGPDILREGQTGWVLPIRNPDAFIERLRWCDTHREELAAIVQNIYRDFQPRSWDDVAADFEAMCWLELAQRQTAR